MRPQVRDHDRRWGFALIAFVPLQVLYLGLGFSMGPPALDAPADKYRMLVADHATLMRWHALIPLVTFVGLLVPASYALRRRLQDLSADRSEWPDLVVAGSLLATATVFVGLLVFAVLGLVPVDELSDALIRSTIMVNAFTVWVAGSFAIALLAASASMAMLRARPSSPKLAWFGLVAAGLSLLSQLWFATGDLDGPLFGLNMLARAMFLAWVAATGVWLLRAGRADLADTAPIVEERVAAAMR
jgi:hypothetical protein